MTNVLTIPHPLIVHFVLDLSSNVEPIYLPFNGLDFAFPVCHKSLLNEINGTIIDKSIANELKCRDLNMELR